jgi:hypothetical protein
MKFNMPMGKIKLPKSIVDSLKERDAAAAVRRDARAGAHRFGVASSQPKRPASRSQLNSNQFAKHLKNLGLEEGKKLTPTMIRNAAANRLAEHSRIELPENSTPAMKAAHTRRGNSIITSVNALSTRPLN